MATMIKHFLTKSSNSFSNVEHFLVDFDPGLSRLRMALKALVVCVLVMACGIGWLDKISTVVATICVFFGLLCVQGKTKREQQGTMLLSIGVFVVMFSIGMAVHGDAWLFDIVLVISCFAAFYLRRFGDRYLVFPNLSVVVLLFTSAFAFSQPLYFLGYMVVTMLGTFVIYFYCFPIDPVKQAKHHYFILFYFFWKTAKQLQDALVADASLQALPKLAHRFVHIEHILKKQALLTVSSKPDSREQRQLVELYAVFRILELIWENLRQLIQGDLEIFQQLKPVMLPVLQSIEQVLLELDQMYNGHQKTIAGREALLAAYHAAAIRVYDPGQSIGTSLVHYSNILFGAKRIAELSQTLEAML